MILEAKTMDLSIKTFSFMLVTSMIFCVHLIINNTKKQLFIIHQRSDFIIHYSLRKVARENE